MGAGNAGGRNDAGPNRTVAQKYTPPKAIGVDKFGKTITQGNGNYQTIDESGKVVGSSFISEGKYKSNRDIDKLPFGSTKVGATILKEPLGKGAIYNRKSFVNLVIGNTKKGSNITTTKEEFSRMSDSEKESLYKGYKDSRRSGATDFYGRDIIGGDGGGNNNQPVIVQKNVGGKTVQTTEAKIEEEKKEYDSRQTKKKGRNKNILTSQRGVMKTSPDYSLGKKSLLGQVV